MNTQTTRYLIYSSRKARSYLCICAARDGRHALSIARRMFTLDRTAYARPEARELFPV